MTFSWDLASVDLIDDEKQDEQLGSKEKFWVTDATDGGLWLVKFARGSGEGTRGEDWAEWIVQHLAELLAIPHARIVPVEIGGRRGIASKSVLRINSGQRLVHGNSLLSESDVEYDERVPRENSRYTVLACQQALRDVGAPLSFRGPDSLDGFDVWAGYLVLDAWIAGRDRHHENWAIVSEQDRRTLAPSYDHGNALGFQEADAKKLRCLAEPVAMEKWVARGRSHHFAGRPDLVDLSSKQARSHHVKHAHTGGTSCHPWTGPLSIKLWTPSHTM